MVSRRDRSRVQALGDALPISLSLSLFAQVGPCAQLVLEGVFPIVRVMCHDHKLAVIDIAEVLEILHTPMVPLHHEDSGHEAVGHQDADAGKVLLAEESPQRFVEPADPVVGVCRRLAVGNAVEEVAVVRSLHPHAFHLCGAWLEISKVLFP